MISDYACEMYVRLFFIEYYFCLYEWEIDWRKKFNKCHFIFTRMATGRNSSQSGQGLSFLIC